VPFIRVASVAARILAFADSRWQNVAHSLIAQEILKIHEAPLTVSA
jgi:hypothetical protein